MSPDVNETREGWNRNRVQYLIAIFLKDDYSHLVQSQRKVRLMHLRDRKERRNDQDAIHAWKFFKKRHNKLDGTYEVIRDTYSRLRRLVYKQTIWRHTWSCLVNKRILGFVFLQKRLYLRRSWQERIIQNGN